ncbi:MAG: matrixin family metalloprotease [Chloroflexi bacterium]|nr:matrixin family metalloprotease [Chloroflexota bacterium]
MTGSPAPARAPRPRLRTAISRTALAFAATAAVLLSIASQPAHAATMPSPTGAIATATAPGYELEGFKWNRAVVPVYYNWEGGTCVFAGNNYTGPATTIPEAVLMETLQASIAEINGHLRGGLTLQLAGAATRAELCSTTTTRPIVVGFGAIASTGQALSFSLTGWGTYSTYTAARVFLTTRNNFTCPTAPIYRDLQHTMTHEVLHAIGIGHSNVASSIMAPTFAACRTPHTMQTDDIAAVNALYPPTLPAPAPTPVATGTPVATATPTPTASPSPVTPGTFSRPVLFSPAGQSLAVFEGGSFDQLEAAARNANASGVWVQDAGGSFRLMVVNGPAFLRDQFRAAFPSGIPPNIAVTLVR